ncbi:MAG TPA: efflux RND transporter permease subunit [Candidatus Caccoplasma merdavium]|nr:efflux RND transporter permease subunit [Candidatus Caccoplasma merdavium]
MKITEFFIKRPTLFWSLMAGILLAGVLAFMAMPKLEDPAVATKQAMVVIPWPGANAHEVELNAAQVMEDELRALPNVHKIKSECQNGAAIITVEFKMTVLLDELEQHFDLLRRKVNDAKAMLPAGCYDPVVIDDMMDVYGIFYALTADGYEYPEMYKYAKFIRRELLGVNGVKRVIIAGNREETINLTFSKETLARNGLIPTQVMMALQNAGKPIDAGSYQQEGDRIPLRIDGAISNEDDIRDLLITTADGKQLRLGDLATVERTYAEPQRNGFFVDGRPAIAICIALENDAIVPDVGKAVDARLAEVMQQVPVGMETEKIFFQPDLVDAAIGSFMLNLLESVLIVILVLVFTMGFRSGLIIGVGLVLTIAVSFPILLACGTTLQRISLGAFIVAMGMLVDNAIVIMDGILIDKKRGFGPKTYLYRIGQNTALPLLGATIIAAATFICIYLSPDSAGEYAKDLFLVLCVSLLASWVLALIQVPMCAKSWLSPREKAPSKEGCLNSPVHRFVRHSIATLIEYKKTTIATAVCVLLLSAYGMTKVKNLFFPDFDYDQFVIEYFLPAQSSPDDVKEDLLEISRTLKTKEGIVRVSASMGSAPAHYCLVRPMTSGGDCYGELIVDCEDYDVVVESIPVILDELRSLYPDAYIRARKYNFSISTSHTVEVEFAGPDPAVLRDLSRQAEEIMRHSPYIDPYSVENNWKAKGKTLVAEYVQQDALRAGISRSDIGNALLAATDGLPVGVIYEQDRILPVRLLVRNDDGSRISSLGDIPVWSMMNVRIDENEVMNALTGGTGLNELHDNMVRSTPLSNVAPDMRLDWEESCVMRLNGKRVIEAQCDPNYALFDATPAKAVSSIKDEIEAISLPDGYEMRWVGEGELQHDAILNLLKYVPITIFLILGILLLLFNSWKKVGLILLCLPFVLCGIVPSLYFLRQPFTFMAIIGMMGLMGMMVKNAIVLVDEINRLITEEHQHPYHAVVEATVSRVRPVLMASLTTIVGMIPLIGDPMYGSMAITIMGGLTVGTIITLILLPLFYTALFHIKKPCA